jgi:pimeloyl-ACP methyl ester carboxylesterase
VPFDSRLIPTQFGDTHAVVSGPPDAPPLILLHPAGLSATQWFPNVGDLSRCFRVYALDFIGDSGKGTQRQAISSPSDCADWLVSILDTLEIAQTSLVGASQGGWFALNFSLSKPERVHKLVLLAPAASLLPFRMAAYLGPRLGPYLPFAFLARPSLRGLFAKRYEVNDLFVNQLAMGLKYFRYQKDAVFPQVFHDEELRGLSVPSLILIGEEEMVYDPKAALDRATRLIPNVQPELIPDAGHILGMEQAELVDAHILEFMSKEDPDRVGVAFSRERTAP